jgi:ABC-2 type transport system permease protein
MQKISDILVLTQGIKILKAAILGQPVGNILIPIVVMAAVGVICTTVALKYFKWE